MRAVGALALAGLLGAGIVKYCLKSAPIVAPAKWGGISRCPSVDEAPAVQGHWPSPDSPRGAPEATGDVPLPASPLLGALSGALEELQEESDPEAREQRLTALIDLVPEGEIEAALNFLEGQQTQPVMQEVAMGLVRRWAQTDPRAAAEAALGLGSANRQEAINAVIPVWAQKELDAALEWVEALPSGDMKDATAVTLAYQAAAVNPATALKIAMDLPPSQTSDQVLAHAAMQWAAKAPREAADWASKLEEKALRERVLSSIATTWGNSDPIAAGQLVIGSIPSGRAQSDALVGIVQRWVQTDAQAAAAWVANFPKGNLRTAAMENVASQWGQADYSKAGDWLNSLPRDASWDAAVRVYASVLAATDRNRARSWAASIQEPALRTVVLKGLENR